MPLSIKLTGSTGEPDDLAERIGSALGRPVVVTVVANKAKSTGNIKQMEEGDAIQKFYDDAKQRGARTGD